MVAAHHLLPLTITAVRAIARSCLAIVLLLAAASAASAQPSSEGTVTGRVIDPSGNGLTGVAVSAMNAAGEQLGRALTTNDGTYTLPPLPPGEYVLTFALAGFREQRHVVRVAAARTAPLNVALALAVIPASVTVVANRARDDPEQTIHSRRVAGGRPAPQAARDGDVGSDAARVARPRHAWPRPTL